MKRLIKYNLFIFAFLFLFSYGKAQNKVLSGWNIGVKAGASRVIGEFPYDFSEAITEFDYKAGLAYDMELSKFVSNHWQLGIEISTSVLKGENNNPSFSAQGYHAAFMEHSTEPVEFENKLSGQKFFTRYYFKQVTEEDGLQFNPFLKAGIGYIRYNSIYKKVSAPANEIIFGKGKNNNYLELSTAVYNLGTGFKTNLSQRVHVIACLDFNFINYDFVDVVHNYTENGERRNLIGIYSDFKIGILYTISGNKPGKGRSRKSAIQQYLPFGR